MPFRRWPQVPNRFHVATRPNCSLGPEELKLLHISWHDCHCCQGFLRGFWRRSCHLWLMASINRVKVISTLRPRQDDLQFDGLMHKRCNSSELAIKLRLFCIKPLIYRWHIQMHFPVSKLLYFNSKFSKMCSWSSNSQHLGNGSDNGSAPDRHQAIIRTNGSLVYWHRYASKSSCIVSIVIANFYRFLKQTWSRRISFSET